MIIRCYNRGVIIHLVLIFVINISCNLVISFSDDQTNDKKIRERPVNWSIGSPLSVAGCYYRTASHLVNWIAIVRSWLLLENGQSIGQLDRHCP